MTQETDGSVDNRTLLEEFSKDGAIHVLKTKEFTAALTKALNEATQNLCDMALSAGVDSTGKPQKQDQNFVR
jgi:hypothetical protein